jgi:putative transposase
MVELMAEGSDQRPPLSIARMCQTLAVSRAAYYRWQPAGLAIDQDSEARDQIQRIALEMPAYAYRRITHELQRRGLVIHHKCVLRLMREDNLLCCRTRSFVRTTDSQHQLGLYPNWLPELAVDRLDQLWVADITYVRLQQEFVYLAILLDAYSRRRIGRALDRYLEAELALAALRMALATRRIRPGLVPHSDRGVQYASHAYIHLLKEHHMRLSMSRTTNP